MVIVSMSVLSVSQCHHDHSVIVTLTANLKEISTVNMMVARTQAARVDLTAMVI